MNEAEQIQIKILGNGFHQIGNVILNLAQVAFFDIGKSDGQYHVEAAITIGKYHHSCKWWFGKVTNDPVLIERHKHEAHILLDRITSALELLNGREEKE